MGREVRRVPADWKHPKDKNGQYIPLLNGSFSLRLKQWQEGNKKWSQGFWNDWGGGWKPIKEENKGLTYEEWTGECPVKEEYMPDWPDSERTHWQMYENTSEGTPISPVMETPETLAAWLALNKASAFAGMTATREQWLATILSGYAPSAVMIDGKMISGVAATPKIIKPKGEC